MTTPHRTLQMALDALTVLLDEWTPAREAQLKGIAAITALREALAADHLRDVAEKVAPAAPVPDGMVPEWAAFLEYWTHESHLQTFADRERFRAAARAMIAASPAAPVVPNGCEKIFTHKWLDPDCIEQGCKSLAAHVVPLTDEQIRSMWKSSEFRGNGGQVDWFCEGIRAAEAHHGITGGKP